MRRFVVDVVFDVRLEVDVDAKSPAEACARARDLVLRAEELGEAVEDASSNLSSVSVDRYVESLASGDDVWSVAGACESCGETLLDRDSHEEEPGYVPAGGPDEPYDILLCRICASAESVPT